VRAGCKFIKEIGECERLAQGRAMLDLLFLRAADNALQAANAMSVSGADVDGATVESTVEDSSKCYRSVSGDDFVRDEQV
jgi:hypothetical protein